MRLLVITQTVDMHDAVLGAYHAWLISLSKYFESIEVICLYEGGHELPEQVTVHSLGKEKGGGNRFLYTLRFFHHLWLLRNSYDAVFVHMNQEYLLLAGWLWKLLRRPTYFWRNHYAGSWLTDVAAFFATHVFCTSKHSYTAKYRKTIIMPVGIDSSRFTADPTIERIPRSILFLARIAPSKRLEMLIDALGILRTRNIPCTATIVGSAAPEHAPYYWDLRARTRSLGIDSQVNFVPSVPNTETPSLYRTHYIFVNTSPSGMFDKTLFEAAACGCVVLAASRDWSELVGYPEFTTSEELADQLIYVLENDTHDLRQLETRLADTHSLDHLAKALAGVMGGSIH